MDHTHNKPGMLNLDILKEFNKLSRVGQFLTNVCNTYQDHHISTISIIPNYHIKTNGKILPKPKLSAQSLAYK
jgi:hypothetical protein